MTETMETMEMMEMVTPEIGNAYLKHSIGVSVYVGSIDTSISGVFGPDFVTTLMRTPDVIDDLVAGADPSYALMEMSINILYSTWQALNMMLARLVGDNDAGKLTRNRQLAQEAINKKAARDMDSIVAGNAGMINAINHAIGILSAVQDTTYCPAETFPEPSNI